MSCVICSNLQQVYSTIYCSFQGLIWLYRSLETSPLYLRFLINMSKTVALQGNGYLILDQTLKAMCRVALILSFWQIFFRGFFIITRPTNENNRRHAEKCGQRVSKIIQAVSRVSPLQYSLSIDGSTTFFWHFLPSLQYSRRCQRLSDNLQEFPGTSTDSQHKFDFCFSFNSKPAFIFRLIKRRRNRKC